MKKPNQKLKISYNKESAVLSVELKKNKSVDSDVHDNVVIDYDKQGKVVRVNFYDFNLNDFRENLAGLKSLANARLSLSVK